MSDYSSEDQNFDYDDDDEMKDEELRPEVNAFERVGRPGDFLGTTDILTQNVTDKFKIQVNQIFVDLRENKNIRKIYNEDLKELLNKVEKIKELGYNISFINPSGYILGYIASNGGKNLNNQNVDYVFNNILSLVESVTQEDVIRYARFYINISKK